MRSDKERALDAYLVAAGRSGDRPALNRLAQRWAPRLFAHAFRLCGDRELAADISQDAWLEIQRGLRTLDNLEAFASWAFRIVTHRHARAIRSLTRRRSGEQAAAREAAPDTAASQEQETELTMIQRAMETLPGPQRAALGLFYREGLRVAEIAVALDAPPGTVKTRLMHARLKLRALLEGEHHEQD